MRKDLFFKADHRLIQHNLINLKQLVFEVTDACNLRCKYCGYAEFYDGYDKRENSYLSFSKAKSVIDYLVEIWKEHCDESLIQPMSIGFYGGEPLLNIPLIKEIIDYLNSLGNVRKKFHFSMTTNAMLLDKYMDYLVEKEFDLLISLDGDEHAQSYRMDASGQNSFDRVIRNVNLLKEKYPAYFERHVNFNAVLHNRNSVEGIYYFIKNNFSKDPTIAPLNNSGIRKDKVEEFWKTYQNMTESMGRASNCEKLETDMFINNPYVKDLLFHIHNSTGNVYNDYNLLMFDKEKLPAWATSTCVPFFKKMFITVNGKIIQCERIHHRFAVGTVFDDRVEMDLEQVANQYNKYVFRYIKQCQVCALKRNCPQCVFHIDDIDSPDIQCWSFKNDEEQQKRIEQNISYLRKRPELYGRIMREVRVSV